MRSHQDTIRLQKRSAWNNPQQAAESTVEREDLFIRSHDHRWAYDLDLKVLDNNGAIVYENWYYLQPGQTKSEFNIFSDTACELEIVMDSSKQETIHYENDSPSRRPIIIEVGNGVLSVSTGLETSSSS